MNFAKLFGKKDKGGGKTKQDNAGQTTLMLDQKIQEQELKLNNLETKTNALQDEAKAKLRAGDKAGAKRVLAKKKKYVEQMKTIEGAISMMEEQKMMLDSTLQMKDVMSAIKQGNQVIKEATKGMNVEDLEQMKEDMENIKADQEELNDFFKDYGEQNTEDVDEELDKLEEEMAKEDAGAMPISNKENLGPVPAEHNKEEAELDQYLAV